MFPSLFEDLNEVVEGYLRARTSDRIEYARVLIRNQRKAIFPLVTGLLNHFKRGRQNMMRLGIALDEEMLIRKTKIIDEPVLDLIVDVINRIEIGYQADLIKLLDNSDQRIVKAAALILSRIYELSPQTINELERIILSWENNPKRVSEKLILYLALNKNNIPAANYYLSKQAQRFGKDLNDFIETLNMLALYELKHKD